MLERGYAITEDVVTHTECDEIAGVFADLEVRRSRAGIRNLRFALGGAGYRERRASDIADEADRGQRRRSSRRPGRLTGWSFGIRIRRCRLRGPRQLPDGARFQLRKAPFTFE
ncbi:MAG: hypothetical protein H0V76_05990 [Blastocatellia bacterium]|nr:hypothetical protein [Blastocatellia bacterium]